MTTEKSDVKKQMQRFEDVCRDANIKVTYQRMEIYREVVTSLVHPDVESIFKCVKERIPTISLDTVYRALWLFNDLGLINTLGTTGERTRFDGNLRQHHHFVCSLCGLMLDFYSKDFNELQLPESIKKMGQSISTHVEVRGVCEQCSKKEKNT